MSNRTKRVIYVAGGILYFLGFIFPVWNALHSPRLIGGVLPYGVTVLLLYLIAGTTALGIIAYRNNNGEGF